MNVYTCPMHPEVEKNKSGRCPHCGMKLILKDNTTNSSMSHSTDSSGLGKLSWKSYLPLIVIIGIIILTSLTLSFKDIQLGIFSFEKSISYFMTGFFITFAGFKLIDLKGFAEGYFTYDLLAQKWFGYGYVYPFIELGFGLSMILLSQSSLLLVLEFLVMAFSGIGVAIKIARKEKFQCACLGTFLKVPLTKVTLIEDFGMAFLALVMLLLK